LKSVVANKDLVDAARADRVRRAVGLDPNVDVLSAGLDVRLPPSTTQISQRASDLIIQLEVSSQALYTKLFQRPTWPFGQSGVTIGIGYDMGYVNKDFLKEDWAGFIPDDAIARFSSVCGFKGDDANNVLGSVRDIMVNWDSALSQFQKRTQPLYIAETEGALDNTSMLSPDSLGAIVSLVYNRGASFRGSGDRYVEMRNIRSHMTAKEFDKIPGEFRSMKRLWAGQPNLAGLVNRRELEALLFQRGLAASAQPPTNTTTNTTPQTNATPQTNTTPQANTTSQANTTPQTNSTPRSDAIPQPNPMEQPSTAPQ
jgi:hypothetical protein